MTSGKGQVQAWGEGKNRHGWKRVGIRLQGGVGSGRDRAEDGAGKLQGGAG